MPTPMSCSSLGLGNTWRPARASQTGQNSAIKTNTYTNTVCKRAFVSVLWGRAQEWPSVHVPVNNQSMKSPCINMVLCWSHCMGEGGNWFGKSVCIILCMCAYVRTENGFLHCRCNNLEAWGRGREGVGSSITISSPPSVSLTAK